MAGDLSILEAIMVEEEDLDLFPEAVVAAHKGSPTGPMRAHALLTAAHKRERDPKRKEKQARYLANLRLWGVPVRRAPSMYTLNGIGTTVYGRYQRAEDGTAIGTHWFTLVFIPVLPLGAYLYADAGGNSYSFYARTPRPPGTWIAPALWGAAAAVSMAFGAGFAITAASSAEVVAYNGFARPVEIRTAEGDFEVGPRSHRRFTLRSEDVVVQAAFTGEEQPFEEQLLPLDGAAFDQTVYNVGGRALLGVEWVLYGPGEPPDFELLVDPVTVRDRIDYLFTDPPKQISTKYDSELRSALVAADTPEQPLGAMGGLMEHGAPEAALRLGRSALLDGVTGGGVVPATLALASMQPGGTRALCDELLVGQSDISSEGPTLDIEVHRGCQDVGRAEGWEGLVDRYRSLVDGNPDSPTHLYLLGRLTEPDESKELFDRALSLDPDHPYALLGLAYHHEVVTGDLEAALAADTRLSEVDPELAEQRKIEIARVHQLLGRPLSPEWLERMDDSVLSLADFLALRDDPSRLQAERQRLESSVDEFGPEVVANTVANAALVAGDLETLREMNGKGAGLELFLALSEGGTLDDAPAEIPAMGGREGVLAWTLATKLGRDTAAHIEALRAVTPTVADLLASGRFTREGVREALVDVPPNVHGSVWFAAWRVTGDVWFAEQARRWAVPPELPYF
jgi:tetratricopeptide (TPR) repeat protein